MNLDRNYFILGLMISLFLVGLPSKEVFPQEPPVPAQQNEQQGQTKEKTKIKVSLVDKVLNDFENAEDWRAFGTSPLGVTRSQKKIQRGPIEDTYDPDNLTEEEERLFIPGENNVLGVKGFIKDRGFDRIEIKPPHQYIVKGIARQISVWALGRNFRHTLNVKLKDYRGKIYKFQVGRLNYFGWRKLTVAIPGWVRQSARFSLFDKNLKFVSLFVASDRLEVGGEFYFYVDQLSMKIDKTVVNYPGSQIKDTW